MTHDDRIRSIDNTFITANGELIAAIERLNDQAATRRPSDGGWSAAQIGYHVALTNEFLSAVMSGGVAEMAVPKPAGFQEALATLELPAKVKTFPALEPPADTSRADAIAKLTGSAGAFAQALGTVSQERCAGTCIQMPFKAVFSLYEVGEFAVGHVHRHIGQLQRTTAQA